MFNTRIWAWHLYTPLLLLQRPARAETAKPPGLPPWQTLPDLHGVDIVPDKVSVHHTRLTHSLRTCMSQCSCLMLLLAQAQQTSFHPTSLGVQLSWKEVAFGLASWGVTLPAAALSIRSSAWHSKSARLACDSAVHATCCLQRCIVDWSGPWMLTGLPAKHRNL